MFIFDFVYVSVHTFVSECVPHSEEEELRTAFLLPDRSKRLNSRHQAWHQVLLQHKSSQKPLGIAFLLSEGGV